MSDVAVLQSNYLPWKGYFDMIRAVDVFVFYDDVQYTKNDWRNRNRIKTASGPIWLTVPVGSRTDRKINEVVIGDPRWQKKHWNSICQAYSKAPYFEHYEDVLRSIFLETAWECLSELNQTSIRTLCQHIPDCHPSFVDSSTMELDGRKQERLMGLLKKVGATRYLSGPAAKAYIDETPFRQEGIELVWMDYNNYPEYPQLHGEFEHAVSFIDLLLHTGERCVEYMKNPNSILQ